ncbi:hypothetical protein GYA49_00950 [Candidatus Beckwithbacteria bacterium]|nr:hypothetical protein [Candidatus Beckwithbacteria bacterium]
MPTPSLLTAFSLLFMVTFAVVAFSAPIYGHNQDQIEQQFSGGEVLTSQVDGAGTMMDDDIATCHAPPPN